MSDDSLSSLSSSSAAASSAEGESSPENGVSNVPAPGPSGQGQTREREEQEEPDDEEQEKKVETKAPKKKQKAAAPVGNQAVADLCAKLNKEEKDFHLVDSFNSHGACIMNQKDRQPDLEQDIVQNVLKAKIADEMIKLGVACPSQRFKKNKGGNFELALTFSALKLAHNVVVSIPKYDESKIQQQLPSSFFMQRKSEDVVPIYYSCRGNSFNNWTALVPVNPEGVFISFFAHSMEHRSAWQKLCEEHAAFSYNMHKSVCVELEKHKNLMKTVHVKQGEMFLTHGGMCFSFTDSSPYVVQTVTYETLESENSRVRIWNNLLKSKGSYDVAKTFDMKQFKFSNVSAILKEECMASVVTALPEDVSWLSKHQPPHAQQQAKAVVVAEVKDDTILNRAAQLHFRVFDPADLQKYVKDVAAATDKRKLKRLHESFKTKVEEAEKADVSASIALFQECENLLKTLCVPPEASMIMTSFNKAKKMHAKLEKACFLKKEKDIQELHDQLINNVQNKLQNSKKTKTKKAKTDTSSTATAPATTVVPVIVKKLPSAALSDYGNEIMSFIDKLPPAKAKLPQVGELNQKIQEFAAAITPHLNDPNFEYDVGPLEMIRVQIESDSPSVAPAVKQKCHTKNGGCGNTVDKLFQADICLSCFKVHLKNKIEDLQNVLSKLKRTNKQQYVDCRPMRKQLAAAYIEVFPEKKSIAPADPTKLATLVKQMLQQFGGKDEIVNNMDEDLDIIQEEEEEENDENEEDDSVVVPDNKVSYESDMDEEDYEDNDDDDDDDDDDEGSYVNKPNANKKRERLDSISKLYEVSHRILQARQRTHIESPLKELFDLHKAAAASKNEEEQIKLLNAAEVILTKLEKLTSVFGITLHYGNKKEQHPFYFITEEEAESKLALLEKNTSGLKGKVEEKKLE
ncbi:MAG: hypothetical protein K2Q45_00445 [Nitrosomonas sp.]|nr:hypothetical protein [Nitrosomonas sp.]